MRYNNWEDCHSNATAFRKKLRKQFCELCEVPATPAPAARKQGVVFTGTRNHLDVIRTSIRMLRHLKFRGGIEVFGSKKDIEAFRNSLRDLDVDIRTFKSSFRVGFSYKIGAILESHFDDVLFLDADNVLVVSPDVLFQDKHFLSEGVMTWADLWGYKCRSHHWPVAADNPEGVMLCGQSSWPDHVIWPVADLVWQPSRFYSQEITSSQLLFDRHRHRIALELALFMTESKFIQNILYGDKDTFRVGLLMSNNGFYFSEEMPGQILQETQRIFLTSWYKGDVLTVDQIKGGIPDVEYKVTLPLLDDFCYSAETESYCVAEGYLHTHGHYATNETLTKKVLGLLKTITELQN